MHKISGICVNIRRKSNQVSLIEKDSLKHSYSSQQYQVIVKMLGGKVPKSPL